MRKQLIVLPVALVAAGLFLGPIVIGQEKATPATYTPKTSFVPPSTPWGHPDLQGTYTNKDENGVPMERPNDLPAQGTLNEAEFQRIVQQRLDRARTIAGRIGGAETGAGPEHWYEHLDAQNHELWLIIDPPDGKTPPLTPDGQRRAAAGRGGRGRVLESPEQHSLYDRCITRGVLGSMLPVIYGNSYRIVQAPDSVAITYEMIHETRVIPLDSRPFQASGVRTYMGEARGHFEGSTLVVESTNFTDKTAIGVNGGGTPHSTALKLTERFTPIDAKTLRWQVTVDDPQTWTRPWTFAMPLKKDATQEPFEYACHEGNYAMRNMLSAVKAEREGK